MSAYQVTAADAHPPDSHRNVRPSGHATMRDIVPRAMWDRLTGDQPTVRAAAGAQLYAAGSAPPVYALISGVVRLYLCTSSGRQFTLRYVHAGDLIGLLASMTNSWDTGAEAVTDVALVPLTIERLRQLSAEYSELSWHLATHVAAIAQSVAVTAAEAEQLSVPARMARHLLELGSTDHEGRRVARVTHQHLADAVGTAREVVSRQLGKLRDAGMVETLSRRVVLTDPARLTRVASGDLILQ